MAWITPKTDWVPSDYFNIEDYNRIRNNINQIKYIYDEIFRGVEWIIPKNLMQYPYLNTTTTVNGITFTDNGDGTITVNGTNSSSSNVTFVMFASNDSTMPFILSPGTYTISGCPSGGSLETFMINVEYTSGLSKNIYFDYGDGDTFILNDYTQIKVSICIGSGAVIDNLIFKPMIEVGSEKTEYEPYCNTIPNSTDNMVSLGYDKSYVSMIYSREINNIEQGLEAINQNTYGFDIGEKQTFQANKSTPLWSEFNRIESACLLLYNTMTAHKNALPRLSFTLGSQKGMRV